MDDDDLLTPGEVARCAPPVSSGASVNDPDLAAAIRRVEESRESHVQWADHLSWCEWCQNDATTKRTVGSIEHQNQVIAEYDNVLACLKGKAS